MCPGAIFDIYFLKDPKQQRCVYKISNPKINFIFNPIHHCVFIKIFSTQFPSWRRYTFLSHLATKSKISARWIKKLVAATDGVNLIIFFITYNRVCIHTPGGGAQPDATNSVILYTDITHLNVRIHIAIFSSCNNLHSQPLLFAMII